MRTTLLFVLLCMLIYPWTVQCQIVKQDSFSVTHVSNGVEVKITPGDFRSDSSHQFRGNNYIIGAWLFSGDFFEENCPDDWTCGLTVDTIFDTNGDIQNLVVTPLDTTITIGDWDCMGFMNGNEVNLGIFGEGEKFVEHSTQSFTFLPTDLSGSPCPDGCTIITDGPIKCSPPDGDTGLRECVARVIAGGTNKFQFMRGEVSTIISNGGNAAGWPNILHNFEINLLEDALPTYLQEVDVSVKRQTLTTSGALNPDTGLPIRGTPLIMEGVIYASGTLASNPNGGINANGNASLDSIGTWTARGWWLNDEQDLDDGYFVAGKQVFDFDDPQMGHLQIMTNGKDQAIPGVPVPQVVSGATDALFGHKGQCLQTIIGKNESEGWNFSYSFATARYDFATDTEEATQKIYPVSMKLYPNPVADRMNIEIQHVRDPGRYSLEISDATGKQVLQKTTELLLGNFQTQLEVTSLPQGWYGIVLKKDGLILLTKGFAVVR